MNRKEALEKLENYFFWDFYDEEYDKETEQNHKQNLEGIIKYLKQPVSLADFLGWEEDVEYKIWSDRYKIIDNKLHLFDHELSKWKTSCYNDDFADFKRAKKVQPEKYYLRLKEKYRNFYGITNNLIYFNLNKKTKENFLSSLKCFGEYQTQFTKEEIEEIKKLDYINFEQLEIVKVEEDE